MLSNTGYSGRMRCSEFNYLDEYKVLKSDKQLIPISNISSMNLKSVNLENKTVASGSSNHDGPVADSPLQVSCAWSPTRTNVCRICATWYTTSWISTPRIYIFFTSVNPRNINTGFWIGPWKSGYYYVNNVIVSRNDKYYRCTTGTNTTEPGTSNSSGWETLSGLPNLNQISYDTFIPVSYVDYLKVTSLEGDLFATHAAQEDRYIMITGSWGTAFDGVYGVSFWKNSSLSYKRIGNSHPTISYNKSTNTATISPSPENLSGRKVLEFQRVDSYNPSGYNEDTRNLFYLVSMVNLESDGYGAYYSLSTKRLSRWPAGTYNISVTYLSTPDDIKSRMYSAISRAKDQINNVLSSYGVMFTLTNNSTSGNIKVTCAPHRELWGFDASASNGWYNGTWSTTTNNGDITSATVKLRSDGEWYCTFDGVAMEELVQACGTGYDQFEYTDDTLHYEFVYRNKGTNSSGQATLSNIDKNILRMCYSSYCKPNMTSEEVAIALNIPKGAYTTTSNSINLSFLESNKSYRLRGFIVNSIGNMTLTSDWITITTPNRPPDWVWSDKARTAFINKGLLSELTATEWNEFIDNIASVIKAVGTLGAYQSYLDNAKVSGSKPIFTADIFNNARFVIGSHETTGINDKEKGDVIKGEYFIRMEECLNKIGK